MASRGVNKAIIVGNLGADPETRYTAGGTAVTNCNVATSEVWRDKQSGDQQERTEWHRIVFFARLAEVAGEYLRKGSKVYIEGRIQTRKWQNKDGVDQYTTEIVANEMQMLGSRDGQGGGNTPFGGGQRRQGNGAAAQGRANDQSRNYGAASRGGAPAGGGQYQPPARDPGFDDDLDDDIPF